MKHDLYFFVRLINRYALEIVIALSLLYNFSHYNEGEWGIEKVPSPGPVQGVKLGFFPSPRAYVGELYN